MDKLDAIQCNQILNKLHEISIIIGTKFGCDQINDLVNYYDIIVSKYNNKTMQVLNKTPTELGLFRANSYKVLSARIKDLHLNGVVFSEELIDSWILFNRKYKWYERTPLANQLKETIYLMMVSEYYECRNRIENKKVLIIK